MTGDQLTGSKDNPNFIYDCHIWQQIRAEQTRREMIPTEV